MYLSLYLSYTFKKLLSCTKYVDLVYVLLHARTAALVPVVTTAVREGDATATQSLRDSAEAIKSFTTVVASESDTDSGAIKKSTSILSTSSNLSNPRRTSSVPNEDDVTPPVNDQSDCASSAGNDAAKSSAPVVALLPHCAPMKSDESTDALPIRCPTPAYTH